MVPARVRNSFAVALVLSTGLAGGMIISTLLASRAYADRGERVERRDDAITVKGSTRQRIRSDKATWCIRLQGEAKALKDSYDALADGVRRTREYLLKRGFTEQEIGLGSIATATFFARDKEGHETREIAGYSLSRNFFVATPDVQRVNQSAGEVTELIEDGVLLVSYPPEYHYSKIADLKVDLLGLASKDARARADCIAQNAGCKVAEVRRASMGVLQITRPESTEVSDSGVYDTTSIDKDVTAVVTLTFGLE